MLLLNALNEQIGFRLILRGSGALICLFALLLTNSRGGLICTSLGLLVAISVLIAHKLKRRIGYTVAFVVLTLIALTAWLTQIGRIGSEGVIDEGRWSVYRLSSEAIRQRPLLGAGAGSFEKLFPSLRTADFSNWGVWDYAHSTILEIAIEMGLPIAAMVVLAACASIVVLIRRAVKCDDSNRAALAAIAGIAVLSYLHSTIDFTLQIPGYLVLFGSLIGCGLAMGFNSEPSKQRSRARRSAAFRPAFAEKEPLMEAGLNAQIEKPD
jgi:O-antigen ligase